MAKLTYEGVEVTGAKKRTKEELIAAQREASMIGSGDFGSPAAALLSKPERAVPLLAEDAGRLWAEQALKRFDLRLVDEQGRMLEDGWLSLPAAPGAKRCDHADDGARCPDAATHRPEKWAGPRPWWCAKHAPKDASVDPVVCLAWKAGEHLDDVLAMGAKLVAERARKALEQPAALPDNIARAVSILKPGELLVLEMPERTEARGHDRLMRALKRVLPDMGAKGIVLEGPVRRESVERLRAALREVGYDVVPLLALGDLRAWLRSLGFQDNGAGVMLRNGGDDAIDLSGEDAAPLTAATIDLAARFLSMGARETREAIQRHVEIRASVKTRKVTGPARLTNALLDGSPSGADIAPEGAPRFWGMA